MFKKVHLLISLLLISLACSSVVYASEEAILLSSIVKPGKFIGRYYYTSHARKRMDERGVTVDDVAWVIGHGNRYNAIDCVQTLDCRQFCVDIDKKLGVVINRITNRVITIFPVTGESHLQAWLAQHKPTKEQRIALAKKHAAAHPDVKTKKDKSVKNLLDRRQ